MIENTNIRNSAFFAILNQYQKFSDTVTLMKVLIDNNSSKFEENGFWFEFGYKYFGILVKGCKDKDYEKALSYDKCSNQVFIRKIMKLVFETDEAGDEAEEIKDRSKIRTSIQDGITSFINEFNQEISNQEMLIAEEIVYSGIEYLANHLSRYDEINIYGAKYALKINNIIFYMPISPREKFRFGIVYPWPGSESAESELLIRFRRAAQDIGFECVMLSDFGKILDENQKETEELVNPKDLDFVLTTHYESHKSVDAFYYHLLWNPPEIPLNVSYYEEKVVDNYIMNDDYLIYDFGGMSNHLRSILINKPRTLEGASTLVGSFPKSVVLEPKLENPKLFYCGMNWEKVVSNSNRHEGLFKLLDETNNVKFFGPEVVESWGGMRPWDGYKCYQYSIPFDGFSILKEINECGICLAISSDIHRRAGAVTNRTYEACAAGAVIISDNNVFMEENFKDAVLFIKYNKNDPQDTFNQIMEKYEWIKANPEKAMEMAKRAQNIFIEKFSMDRQLIDVVRNHYNRFRCIEKDLFAQDDNKSVLVTSVINSIKTEKAKEIIDSILVNVDNQYYRNITIGMACDNTIYDELREYCFTKSVRIELFPLVLFDEKKARKLTDGQVIRYVQKKINHEYYINMIENEVWYYDHISTLVRALEDVEGTICAYSGRASQDKYGYRRTDFFGSLKVSTVYYQNHPDNLPIPGQFLFRSDAHDYLPDFLFDSLDGLEHAAYINLLWFKYNKKLVFSKRLTCIYQYDKEIKQYNVVDHDRQIRFIRGLVKYDLPFGGVDGGKLNIQQLGDSIAYIPIKAWFKLRYYKIRLRTVDTKTKRGKAILKKYEDALNDYRIKIQ
jgi:hypothetical protein